MAKPAPAPDFLATPCRRLATVGADGFWCHNRGLAPVPIIMTPIVVALLTAALVAGCASSPAPSASKVADGDPAVVNRDCKLLGTVTGRSIFGGSEAGRTEGAMQDARTKAAAMGATHVVFLTVDNGGMLNTGQATARTYRCDAKPG